MTASGEAPTWFIDALAQPVIEDTVAVSGCRIAYRQWGQPGRPPLLFVHGGGAHSRWWDHIAPFLADRYLVRALDLSGHGDSDRRPSYTFDRWAEEVTALAVAGQSDVPPVIVAHSLGARAAICAAADHGDDFAGVVLLDPPTRIASPEQEAGRKGTAFGPLRVYPTREEGLARFRTVPEQEVVLPYVEAHIKSHSLREVDGGWTWKFDPRFFDNFHDFRPDRLPAIGCRVAVLQAEWGLKPRLTRSHAFFKMLGPRASLTELPLAYHHMMLDRPIALVAALRALLSSWQDHPAELANA